MKAAVYHGPRDITGQEDRGDRAAPAYFVETLLQK
jgi:hypothetical protein